LQVKPELTYVTWRHYLLGMGVDGPQAGFLDLRRADLIRLQFKPRIKWSRLRFAADISQWIPIHVKKASSGSSAGDSDGTGDSGSTSSEPSSWGGLSISLIMTSAF
jgi:hypothetical protein